MDLLTGSIAFLAIVALVFFGLIHNPTVQRVVAHIAITKEAIGKLRRAVGDACNDFDMGDMAPDDAEDAINEIARHTIGKTLAEINPRRRITVNANWPPDQRVTIVGDIAVIRPDIGILIMGSHERIEPITVRIKRAGVVKLDNRPPIKAVFDEMRAPPPKVAAASAPKAAQRATPAPRTPRKLS